ncbi:MAG: hybrid sensor histidine kinase/response regulator [Proteobacteria bacterium]|nr:MAG: hybrid sensor histidine kinase/response regulator [Pseudomonadota bacterium]
MHIFRYKINFHLHFFLLANLEGRVDRLYTTGAKPSLTLDFYLHKKERNKLSFSCRKWTPNKATIQKEIRRMLERVLIIFAVAMLSFASTAKAEGLRLKGMNDRDFNASVSILEDMTAKMSFQDILVQDKAGLFTPRKNLHKNGFGFTRSAIWVKAEVFNDSLNERWIVGSPRPDFTTMDVYILDDEGRLVESKKLGTTVKEREIHSRLPAGPVKLPANKLSTIYIKVESPLQLSLSFHLLDDDSYLAAATRESNFFFAYFGTIIALMLYNLCLFLFLRYYDYLFYVIWGAAMLINAYIQGGFAEVHAYHLPFLNSTADAYRVLLFPSIASVLYTRSFLRLKTVAPKLNRFMGELVWVAVGFAIFFWTDYSYEFRHYASYFDGVAVLLVFISSIIAIRKGDKTAKVFLLAWGILALCVAIWVMGNVGIFEKNYLIAASPLFGNMSEMVLMSIALALRIKEIDQKKLEAEMRGREKDNLQHLLRMVCHDISNPLSIIKTVYFLASRKGFSEVDDEKQWSRIKRASDSIEGIVNQVRKYEAFRSGKIAFELKPCSMKKVFEDVDFFFSARAQEKDLDLTYEFLGGLSDVIRLFSKCSTGKSRSIQKRRAMI